MSQKKIFEIQDLHQEFIPPVLIISTQVGRGVYSVGQAVAERLQKYYPVFHAPIEDFLPEAALNEDVRRYRFISNHLRWLLYLIYRLPLVYYRKYLREKLHRRHNLPGLQKMIEDLGINTVLCCSHRPAFWTSVLKKKTGAPFKIWGLVSEFGRNLGWKYIFWDQMSGYLAPVPRKYFDFNFPDKFKFSEINLPVKQEYLDLAGTPGDRNTILIVCGFWGQGPIGKIIGKLRKKYSDLKIIAVCGDNIKLQKQLYKSWGRDQKIQIFGAAGSLAPLVAKCGAMITKPGVSTIIEGRATGRRIFLLPGMPVAEDHNARFAIQNFGAEWFSLESFDRWFQGKPGIMNK